MHPIMRIIKEHFDESGLSQREIARRLETSQSAVSDLLTGLNSNPTLSTLDKLCDVFDLTLSIIGVDGKPEPEINERIERYIPADITIKISYDGDGHRTTTIIEEPGS